MCICSKMNDDVCHNSSALPATRSPLIAHTNAAVHSLPQIVLKPEDRQVRRKSSFVRRLDSSEDLPSSHGSIVAAEYLSPFNSEASSYRTDNWDTIARQISPPPELPSLETERDENLSHRLSLGVTPIIYGHGTPLATIIEQKSSNPTIRDSSRSTSATRSLVRPRTASDLSSSTASDYTRTPFLSNSLLKNKFSGSGIIRRLESLSAADSLESIKLSWPAGYVPTSDGNPRSTSPIDQIYAQPLKPLQPPFKRPSTPPGMPSWTAAQQRPRAPDAQNQTRRGWGIHEASSVLSRLFGNSETPRPLANLPINEAQTASSYGIRGPWDGIPAHRRTVSAPVLRGAPRFRPPRSGHGLARLDMHPFARAQTFSPKMETVETTAGHARTTSIHPTAEAEAPLPRQPAIRLRGKRKLGQRVRFTPSTGDENTESHRDTLPSVSDVQVCPHKRTSSMQLQMISHGTAEALPLPTGYGPLPGHSDTNASMNCQSLPLIIDAEVAPENAFASRSRCWRCRIDAASRKMERAWDRSSRWCCWYCCGIDMKEILADDEDSLRTSPAPRVRSFDWERSRSR